MKQEKRLDLALTKAMRPSCQKYGFLTYRMITHWNQIVGERMSKLASPLQIVFEPNKSHDGALIIAVSNPGFALEIQSLQSLILSKIAIYFGYQAISRIKIKIVRNNIDQIQRVSSTEIYQGTKSRVVVQECIDEQEDSVLSSLIEGIQDKEISNELHMLKNILFQKEN